MDHQKRRIKHEYQLVSLAKYFNIPVEKVNRFYIATYARNYLKWFSQPIRNDKQAKHIITCAYKRLIGPIKLPATSTQSKYKVKKPSFVESKTFYDSDGWRSLRYQALKLYGRRCMVCGATPETGAQLHVDHIKPRSKYPELELVLANLQILCRDCNLGKSNTDSIDWRQADNFGGVGADSSTTLESDRDNVTAADKPTF